MNAYRNQERWDSRGRRLLLAFLSDEDVSQTTLAKWLGVERSTISMLVCGERRPSLDLAIAIERRLKIACVTWDEAPLRHAQ